MLNTSSRRILSVALALALVAMVVGCGSDDDSDDASTGSGASTDFEAKEPLKVGYSVFDLKQPYFQIYAKGIQDAAEEAGYEYVESDQKSSEQVQVSGSADLINQGISGLIVSPIQPDALPATVDAAHAQKIPVVIGDVGAVGDYDTFILSDNYQGGQLAAKYMLEQLADKPGTKEIAVVELDPAVSVNEARLAGFTDEIAKNDDFKIVSSVSGSQEVEGGFQVTQDALSANPNLAGVYTLNDPMGEGASQALKQAGKNAVDDVLLVSFNGDPPALDLIESGEMAATIAQDPYQQGQDAMQAVIDLLDGTEPPFTDPATKTIEVPVELVTKENVAALEAERAKVLE